MQPTQYAVALENRHFSLFVLNTADLTRSAPANFSLWLEARPKICFSQLEWDVCVTAAEPRTLLKPLANSRFSGIASAALLVSKTKIEH